MNAESSFGMIAKNRRRELGLTQDELARRVGCAPITLRKIEADDLRPSVQIAERMAMALNIPLEERAAFVKLARVDRAPVEEPTVTPMPLPSEIGIEDLSGRAIRGYALGERLGNGGMGAVYRAVQPLVEREVAIKIILPQYANHPDFIRRFEAEAQLVARLEHPHIVPLYDYWREPSVAYLVMRLLRGGSVHSLLRNGTALSPEIVLRMMEQIGSALSSAHRAGVVHRDLKPANVLLDEDNNAYLADFGIAKNLSSPSSETQADMVIGSPDYISPEQIRSEFVRPQTDIYALGVMLYELLTGKVPFHGPTPFDVMHQHLSAPLPPLAANRSGLPKSLDDVIEHATAKDPLQRYETVDTMLNDFRKALGINLHEIKSNTVTSQPTAIPTAIENPYKGLRAFGEGDAQDFFGREALTQQLLVRLGEGGELARFLAVVGPSGSGKSSVVKAGLIPALRRGALPGSENWFIIEMMPGSHPLEELEAALLRVAVNPPASLIEQFQKDSRGLIRAVRRSLPSDPNIELVLVIDQFEEVFTLLQDEDERLHFLGLLVSAILDEHSRIRVVLTLRADFIDRPLGYVDFGELMRQRMELVLPLTPDELESAIVAPSQRVGLNFESGLVAAIAHDLGDQPGTLPLLQYALTELYEKRTGNTLTKSAYQEIGGVLGALGRRAEEVFAGLDSESQSIAKQLFLRLVTLGEGVEDTRRRALIAELENLQLNKDVDAKSFSTSFQKVLDTFGHARLLSFDRDPDTRGPTVEVAHEAIIREWARLRDWLNESRTLVRMQRQLAHAASEWEEAQRDHSFLLTGTKLAQYEGWTINSAIALTQHELAYLKASITEEQRIEAKEIARQQHELETAQKLVETERASSIRLRNRNRVISVVGVIALILAVIAGVFSVNSNWNAQQAASRELAAASISNLNIDPERSILLALEAISKTYTKDKTVLREAEEALHQAVQSMRIQLNLNGHMDGVYQISFSPDGKRLATASSDKTIKLWDATTGKELLTLQDTNQVYSAVFSPDGKYLATAGADNTAKLWDATTGKELLTFAGHTGFVWSVAFSPDGTRIATASQDGTAKVWDVSTGKELFTLEGHSDWVTDVAFSPDGTRIATASQDGTAKIWDATTGNILSTLTGHSYTVEGLAFSPDGLRLATVSQDRTAKIWDISTGKEILTLVGNRGLLYAVAFSPDGKHLATCGSDGVAKVWDAESGIVELSLYGHTKICTSITFSPDGKRLGTTSHDGTAKVWDISIEGGQEWFNFSGVYGLAINSDGSRFTVIADDGSVKILDTATGKELVTLIGAPDVQVNNLAFSPDGTRIASGEYQTAKIWDALTGKELITLNAHTDWITGISFSSDGKHLATVSYDQTAKIWDANTYEQLMVLSGYTDQLIASAFSPDGKQLATGTGAGDKVVKIWEVATGKELLTLTDHTNQINAVAFSPDGTRIAATSYDSTVIVWDADTGKKLLTLSGHQGATFGVSFSPDGTKIATSGDDGTIRIWDAATGREILNLSGNFGAFYDVAFNADGSRLITTNLDGIGRVYALRIEDLIAIAKSRLTRTLTTEECQKYLHVDVCPAAP